MHNSRVYRLAFSERKMPHDTVNVADFAALECKAAVKSVAVCAMREKQQNYGAETKMFLPYVRKGRLYRRWKKLLKRDL
ncbi:hypothetical protein DW983_11310 [Ruminococcus sp. AM49-8]|nr:hypothetical protein DW983_11310 [Ruminococcus sp. AM49-8]